MVNALLEGRKTQTRRILKPQPIDSVDGFLRVARDLKDGKLVWETRKNGKPDYGIPIAEGCLDAHIKTVAVGDRLWVREAFAYVGSTDPGWLLYRANGYVSECHRHGFDIPFPPESEVRWKPSIQMPRAISRITLTVTDVRVQRLQDISEEDARAEGIGKYGRLFGLPDSDWDDAELTAKAAFQRLWDSLNADRAPWKSNPWVVAVSFDVRKGNIDD